MANVTAITDLQNLPNLYTLNLAANEVTELYITENNALGIINVSNNQLSSLDLTPLINLVEVNASSNSTLNAVSVSTLNNCTYFNANGSDLNSSVVDNILVALDNNGLEGAYVCFLAGGTNGVPSSTGLTAANNLTLRGWTVTYNT